jgi:hypothetical protein
MASNVFFEPIDCAWREWKEYHTEDEKLSLVEAFYSPIGEPGRIAYEPSVSALLWENLERDNIAVPIFEEKNDAFWTCKKKIAKYYVDNIALLNLFKDGHPLDPEYSVNLEYLIHCRAPGIVKSWVASEQDTSRFMDIYREYASHYWFLVRIWLHIHGIILKSKVAQCFFALKYGKGATDEYDHLRALIIRGLGGGFTEEKDDFLSDFVAKSFTSLGNEELAVEGLLKANFTGKRARDWYISHKVDQENRRRLLDGNRSIIAAPKYFDVMQEMAEKSLSRIREDGLSEEQSDKINAKFGVKAAQILFCALSQEPNTKKELAKMAECDPHTVTNYIQKFHSESGFARLLKILDLNL